MKKFVFIFLILPLNLFANGHSKYYFYNSAAEKYNHHDYKGAVEGFSIFLVDNPNDAKAYMCRGLAWFNKNEFSNALSDYNKAVELDSTFIDAYFNIADLEYKQKNFENAIKYYTKTIELNNKDVMAYLSRGLTKQDTKDYSGAINDFTKIIEFNPKQADVYLYRGIAKSYLGDYTGTIEDLSKADKMDSTILNTYFADNNMKEGLVKYKAAIANYNSTTQSSKRKMRKGVFNNPMNRIKFKKILFRIF